MANHVRIKQVQTSIQRGLQLRYTDRSEALRLGEKALQDARSLSDRKTEGQALRLIAACTYYLSRDRGYELGVQATEIAIECEDWATAAGGYFVQFVFFNDLGMYDRASEMVQAAYNHARQAGDRGQEALALYNLGVNTEHRDGLERAVEYYECAYRLSRGLRNYPFRTIIASAYAKCAPDRDQGIKLLKKVLDEALKTTCPFDVLQAYGHLAEAYFKEGDLDNAIDTAVRGLTYAHRPGAGYFASLYETLGQAYLKLDKTEKALSVIDEGLAAAHDDTKNSELQLIALKARVLRQLGRNAQAYDTLEHYIAVKTQYDDEVQKARTQQLETVHQVEMAIQDARMARQQADMLTQMNSELRRTIQQKDALQREMFRLASEDDLTHVANRRQLIQEGLLSMEQFKHLGATFTVLVADLDFFKHVNDTFGHIAGDEALRRIASSMRGTLRDTDSLGRVGGEEFCIILPDADSTAGCAVAERIRQRIAKITTSDFLDGQPLTVSIGVCQVRDSHASFFEVLNEADQALFVAKRTGRNRVHLSTDLAGAAKAA